MKKIVLEKDIVVYQFEAEPKRFLGVNITVLLDGNDYLCIDSGYEKHMKQLIEDLPKGNCKKLVFSHFHPDHVYGNHVLKCLDITGSIYGIETLSKFNDESDSLLLPTNKISIDETIYFGRHKLNLSLNKGHSNCGMIITLNDKYLFVGDDLMYTNKGESVMPYLAENDANQQINAILNIEKVLEGKVMIPAHGKILENNEIIRKDIKDKILYLNYIQENNSTFSEFVEKTGIDFISSHWHEHNSGE